MPPLRYRDQTAKTPISKPPEKKPGCAVLSACEEPDDISHKIQAAVEQSMQKIVPQIVEPLEKNLIASVEQAVNYAVAGIKEKKMKRKNDAGYHVLGATAVQKRTETITSRDHLHEDTPTSKQYNQATNLNCLQ